MQPSLSQWIGLSPASFIGKGCLRRPYTAKLSIAIWLNLLLQEPHITDAGLCCESVPRPGGQAEALLLHLHGSREPAEE